jgi:hypothetical protein
MQKRMYCTSLLAKLTYFYNNPTTLTIRLSKSICIFLEYFTTVCFRGFCTYNNIWMTDTVEFCTR